MAKVDRRTIVVAQGPWGTVECVILADGSCPAKDFLDEIEAIREKGKDKPHANAKARFMFLFVEMSQYGRISPKRFSHESGKIYGFKHEVRNVPLRFACFQDGKKWILTHGFKKPGSQQGLGVWPKSQIERAELIMKKYIEDGVRNDHG